MSWFDGVIRLLRFEAQYYDTPVIDKLSDYDKGVHKGRADGIAIACNRIIKAAHKEILRKGKNEDNKG